MHREVQRRVSLDRYRATVPKTGTRKRPDRRRVVRLNVCVYGKDVERFKRLLAAQADERGAVPFAAMLPAETDGYVGLLALDVEAHLPDRSALGFGDKQPAVRVLQLRCQPRHMALP